MEKMKLKKCISICLSGGDIPSGKHMTLNFKPEKSDLPELLKRLGEVVSFSQGPILEGMGIVCVVCSLDKKELYTGESLPHVTMECLDDTPPNNSNLVIQSYVQENGPFKPKQFDAGFVSYISAMYYTKNSDGKTVKAYSTSIEDWDI